MTALLLMLPFCARCDAPLGRLMLYYPEPDERTPEMSKFALKVKEIAEELDFHGTKAFWDPELPGSDFKKQDGSSKLAGYVVAYVEVAFGSVTVTLIANYQENPILKYTHTFDVDEVVSVEPILRKFFFERLLFRLSDSASRVRHYVWAMCIRPFSPANYGLGIWRFLAKLTTKYHEKLAHGSEYQVDGIDVSEYKFFCRSITNPNELYRRDLMRETRAVGGTHQYHVIRGEVSLPREDRWPSGFMDVYLYWNDNQTVLDDVLGESVTGELLAKRFSDLLRSNEL